MNFNLYSQNLLILLCVITTALAVYLLLRFKLQWYYKRLPIILLLAAVLIISIQITTGNVTHSASDLPSLFWLMVAPFALSLSFLIVVFASRMVEIHPTRKQKTKKQIKAELKLRQLRPRPQAVYPAAAVLIVIALLFSLTQINDYYAAFPTIGSMFDQASVLNANRNQVLVQYSTQGSPSSQNSIETWLNKLNPLTNGKIFHVTIPGKQSGFAARTGYVYEPAIALANNTVKLPVLVLLAGIPGAPANWLIGGDIIATANAFAKQHGGITPYIFIVDDTGSALNDTECVNSPRGNVETYLTTDVPNYIKQHYSVLNSPANWAVGGLSMGGMCATMLALRHPNTFHYFLDFGGEIGPEDGSKSHTIATLFHGSLSDYNAHQPYQLLKSAKASKLYKGMGGFLAGGSEDEPNITVAEKNLYVISRADGLHMVYETVEGKHTFEVWKENFKDALPWLSNQLGATECSSECY